MRAAEVGEHEGSGAVELGAGRARRRTRRMRVAERSCRAVLCYGSELRGEWERRAGVVEVDDALLAIRASLRLGRPNKHGQLTAPPAINVAGC